MSGDENEASHSLPHGSGASTPRSGTRAAGETLQEVSTPYQATVAMPLDDVGAVERASRFEPDRDRARGKAALKEQVEIGSRYVLRTMIGEGASAHVWEAVDRRLDRVVALKVFDALGPRDPSAVAVIHEAQATGRVISEFVTRIYSSFIDEGYGIAAIEMELCEEHAKDEHGAALPATRGEPLDKKVKPSGVETERELYEAVRWVQQAALGVQAAHDERVFHRDLKPANILLRPFSSRCQVVDFGLAAHHVKGRASAAGADYSLDGDTVANVRALEDGVLHIAGTPAYMAPEQARGLPPLDVKRQTDRARLVRIDVYGLGAVLFELLTGSAPHARDEDDSIEAIVLRARENDAHWDLLGRGRIPEALAKCVKKALATNPEHRHSSAAAFASDLGKFLAHQPLGGESLLHRAVLAHRRNPWFVNTALAAAVALGVSLGVILYTAAQASAAERRQKEAEASILRLKDTKLTLESEVTAERAKLRELKERATVQFGKLSEDVASAKGARERAEAELARSSKQGNLLSLKLDVAEKRLAERNAELAQRQARLLVLDSELEQKTRTLAARETELSNTRNQLATQEAELTTAQADLARKQTELTTAQNDLATAQAQKGTAQTELDAARSKMAELEREVQRLRAATPPAPPPGEAPAPAPTQ